MQFILLKRSGLKLTNTTFMRGATTDFMYSRRWSLFMSAQAISLAAAAAAGAAAGAVAGAGAEAVVSAHPTAATARSPASPIPVARVSRVSRAGFLRMVDAYRTR